MAIPCRGLTRINGVKCTGRRSLRQRPSWYIRPPKCPSCGGRKWTVDKYRIRVEMARGVSCDCGGYWFIHRRGSKCCHYHPQAEMLREDSGRP